MKISLKQALALGMLAATSGSAFADAVVPNGGVISTYSATTPLADNGGLTFSLFSNLGSTTFSLNNYLGLSLNDVLPTEMDQAGLTLVWHIEGLNNVPGSVATSNLVWGVTASDNGSTNTAGSIRLVTTVNNNSSVIALTNGQIANTTNTWNTTVNSTNNVQNASPVDFTVAQGSPTDVLDKLAVDNAVAGFSWVGGLSDTLSMYQYGLNGTRAPNNIATQSAAYAGIWSFDYNTATLKYEVPAVPVPAAIWLLLSGLTGLGIIGRRKDA